MKNQMKKRVVKKQQVQNKMDVGRCRIADRLYDIEKQKFNAINNNLKDTIKNNL